VTCTPIIADNAYVLKARFHEDRAGTTLSLVVRYPLAQRPRDQVVFQVTTSPENLLRLADAIISECDQSANEEAEYLAELNRGYAQDRI